MTVSHWVYGPGPVVVVCARTPGVERANTSIQERINRDGRISARFWAVVLKTRTPYETLSGGDGWLDAPNWPLRAVRAAIYESPRQKDGATAEVREPPSPGQER